MQGMLPWDSVMIFGSCILFVVVSELCVEGFFFVAIKSVYG